jgi:hypothetical protein
MQMRNSLIHNACERSGDLFFVLEYGLVDFPLRVALCFLGVESALIATLERRP